MATLEAARSLIPAPVGTDAPQLRILTCGSVDDGKSTLLGRLLYDAQAVLDDQLSALDRESRRWGTAGDARDYALLLDGLAAEREQGITIDVAYRYFSSKKRSFILADTPGHEQYTRNMATGASQAELAIILIDARKGVLPQTRRHAFIASTLGIRHAVLAINKMDLVGFDETRWQAIANEFRAVAAPLGFASIVPIPLSARDGDNVAARSARMPWYEGPTLLDHLETVDVGTVATAGGFALPVQLVLRPDAEFRGYAGTIARGEVRVGDAVVALPGGQRSTIARIIAAGRDVQSAGAGEAATLALATEIDIARGDVLAAAEAAPPAGRTLGVTLLWMSERALAPDRDYTLLLGPATAGARLGRIDHEIDIESYAERPAATLRQNELGRVELALDRPLAAAPYRQNRSLGALVLVDRVTKETVALGVVEQVGIEPPRRGAARRDWFKARRMAGRAALGGGAMAALAGLLSGDATLASGLGFGNMLILAFLDRILTPAR